MGIADIGKKVLGAVKKGVESYDSKGGSDDGSGADKNPMSGIGKKIGTKAKSMMKKKKKPPVAAKGGGGGGYKSLDL